MPVGGHQPLDPFEPAHERLPLGRDQIGKRLQARDPQLLAQRRDIRLCPRCQSRIGRDEGARRARDGVDEVGGDRELDPLTVGQSGHQGGPRLEGCS